MKQITTFKIQMRVLFVISALLWSWLVGRCITFGPTTRGLCWRPRFHASTWYRLTPLPRLRLPHRVFPWVPLAIAILAIPALFIDIDWIHIATVLRLVSEHAFIPIFVAHVHSECVITWWAIANLGAAAASIYIFTLMSSAAAAIAIVFTTITVFIHIAFLWTQLYLTCVQPPIRKEHEYEKRQPRLV